ncbi:hypothetical protein Dda_0631 [Drechslerella dactyloides]|uniref:Uncharacterized protein n=1 Tax=Drechslerella dactyloides TaxID=74499 RepID=A0AAD6J584_DREDA|nr:hypothetical protein Dda_0631 [Drechslerella dactyloides]
MSASATSLPIPAPERPRNLSIFDLPFDTDFILYDEDCDDMSVDLDDITTRGVSKASSFAHQEYKPSMLMYHPHDATSATYPAPSEWEKMFEDLASQPQTRSPSISSVNTTAAAAPDSRRGSLQLPMRDPHACSCSCSRRSSSSHVDYPLRSSRRDSATAHVAHRRLPAMPAGCSFYRSTESLLHPYSNGGYSQDIAPSSRRSSKTCLSIPFTTASSTTTTAASSTASRRRSRRHGSRGSALLLSHIGAGHSHYRMDSHSGDLQEVVAGIPVAAFIHPRMHFPGDDERVECGPVEEDGGYEDAYPLRVTRLWSFDEPMFSDDMDDSPEYFDEEDGEGDMSPLAGARMM